MKHFFFLIALTFSVQAFAKVSIYDYVMEGKENLVGINQKCAEFVRSKPQNLFQIPELKTRAVTLRSLEMGLDFFHYTNATVVPEIIERDGNFKNIFEHTMKSMNTASGAGFYIAANPFSSKHYGTIQVRINLNPDAKVLVDFDKSYNKILKRSQAKSRHCEASSEQFQTLIFQENEIDLVYYMPGALEWFALLNDDMILDTAFLEGLDDNKKVIPEMAKVGRLLEAFGGEKSEHPGYQYNLSYLDQVYAEELVTEVIKLKNYKLSTQFFQSDYWALTSNEIRSRAALEILQNSDFPTAFIVKMDLGKSLCGSSITSLIEEANGEDKLILEKANNTYCRSI